MNRFACGQAVVLFSVSWLSVVGRAAEEMPPLLVNRLTDEIRIDGRLDDACYRSPPAVADFVVAGAPDARPQPTQAWLFWQPERLLFAFQVHDEETIAAPPSNRESDVDPQDRVELFLWSGAKSDTYWCVEVGALGAVHDYAARFYREFDQAWSPAGMRVVVARTATGYGVEGELPRAALETMGFSLRAEESFCCGLFRADFSAARPKDPTWICWVDARGAQPDFHVAESFGRIRLVDQAAGARASGDDPPGARKTDNDNNVSLNDRQPPLWKPDAGLLVMRMGDRQLEVSLSCPHVRLEDGAGSFGGDLPTKVEPGGQDGSGWECAYSPVRLASGAVIDRVVRAEWHPREGVLRKWLRLRASEGDRPLKIGEIVLETFDASKLTHEFRPGPPQSYPLLLDGVFAGVEFPVASTRVEEGRAILGHRPLCVLEPNAWYESRHAVYGLAPPGGEVLAFHEYIEKHRPAPKGMHFNYNSWWTSPVPFSEKDILGLMSQCEEQLFRKHGVGFDSFTIDLGWSDPHGVWDINRQLFPDEFAKIRAGAEAMGSRLGLWTSPSSCYPPAVDPQWAKDHGYEGTGNNLLSLAGEKYREKYGATIADYVARFNLGQIKLDGLYLGGPDHMAGPYPAEATAAGAVEAFDRMRAAGRDVWLEATYSAYASPWWLFHVNSVIGCFGDDSPHGRVPCPVYRESYTTARDYFNLQGADRLPSPIPAQEVLGIIHQSADDLMNDAVTTVLRGHAFISLYVNPKYMDEQRWAKLARVIAWSRDNAALLTAPGTLPLRPATWLREGVPWLSHEASMPREPYGYAHWNADRGLVLLRNPWVEKQFFAVAIPREIQGTVHAVSLYPEPRCYAESLRGGDRLEAVLAPYETVVLSFAVEEPPALPRATAVVGTTLTDMVKPVRTVMRRVVYDRVEQPLGPDYTSQAPPSGTAIEIDVDFALRTSAANARARVLVLLEGKTVPDATGELTVDGQEVPLRSVRSDAGFVATGAPVAESWHFLEGTLPESSAKVSLRVSAQDPDAIASMWIVADKPGGCEASPSNALPAPERILLDSVCVLPATPLASVSEQTRAAAKLERIDGVFLDALEPVSVQQGWGTLQRNRSVWGRELVIGGTRFRRGLGTHAPSEIVYQLDGTYRSFQSWAGPDMATYPTVGFAVVVDGRKCWESGPMARGDAPKRVDVDITGAKELRLLVDDGGNGLSADHADWADAKLLR